MALAPISLPLALAASLIKTLPHTGSFHVASTMEHSDHKAQARVPEQQDGGAQLPRSTIIVPSYNRPDALGRCLQALIEQDDGDFEVVVVDDGSATPLQGVCAPYGPLVRCIRQENAGPAKARNRAVSEARGRFLAFTDDDCRPRPDWLRRLREAHAGVDERLVGGWVVNGLPDDMLATTSQELCDYLYDYFGARNGTMPFFTTNNMGCSKAEFERVGKFDERFSTAAAEDREFGMRWQDLGGELHFTEGAVVDHYHGMTLQKFLRQHWNYGRGAHRLHRIMSIKQLGNRKIEPFRFYRDLVFYPVRKNGMLALPRSIMMGLTQFAMVVGYAQERFRKTG
ncbi:glycosyltransferase family 2 protein [Ovoidimarina sediminis]|uniref:glycosyltransferase family 2 protein n=1 Tax=Ovoidimarina sediminis TaxID=3079856 RepID=UPI002914957D|nr:glycosyltransferase [Rhodophyticola sp. MJ-SS7]MDU8942186.1 glycosyltransferase [Rhodophyticola sp. MJ-SS7]